MALHFTREEFADRQTRTRAEMAKAGLDGLLIFRQESMYWLTGYDTIARSGPRARSTAVSSGWGQAQKNSV